jgi:hypothetical protein
MVSRAFVVYIEQSPLILYMRRVRYRMVPRAFVVYKEQSPLVLYMRRIRCRMMPRAFEVYIERSPFIFCTTRFKYHIELPIIKNILYPYQRILQICIQKGSMRTPKRV